MITLNGHPRVVLHKCGENMSISSGSLSMIEILLFSSFTYSRQHLGGRRLSHIERVAAQGEYPLAPILSAFFIKLMGVIAIVGDYLSGWGGSTMCWSPQNRVLVSFWDFNRAITSRTGNTIIALLHGAVKGGQVLSHYPLKTVLFQ